jgi:hypothetical protein
MIRMTRVDLLEELSGPPAKFLKSRESLRNGTQDRQSVEQLCFVIWKFVVSGPHRVPVALVTLCNGPGPRVLVELGDCSKI